MSKSRKTHVDVFADNHPLSLKFISIAFIVALSQAETACGLTIILLKKYLTCEDIGKAIDIVVQFMVKFLESQLKKMSKFCLD